MSRIHSFNAAASLAIAAVIAAAPASRAQTYIYPSKGQSAAQQDKDDAECQAWAKRQPGTQPAQPPPPPAPPPPPPGAPPPGSGAQSLVRGGARGAALGAVGGAIAGDAGKGAAAGAAMGGMMGGMKHMDQKRAAYNAQAQYNEQVAQQQAAYQRQVSQANAQVDEAYKRAFAACLEGRGYTVK